MREIKFRAWDRERGCICDMDDLFNLIDWDSLTRLDYILIGKKDDFLGFNPDNYELMQYTGLKDKNGKEIYEGDIVKCSVGCGHEMKWSQEIGGTYGGGMPGWHLDGLLKNCGIGYAWTGKEEVIGNIYENPELLQKV